MTQRDDASTLEFAAGIPTTLLADSVRDVGHPHQVVSPSIQSVNTTVPRVAGWAYTVIGGPREPHEQGPDLAKARAIDGMQPDTIAVWAGGDVEDVCLFGDLLAAGMQVRGVRGIVVDGGVRDVDELDESGLAVYARYRTPKASTGVWRVRGQQEPAELKGTGGVAVGVEPGDLVVADANGVVCIPRSAVADALEAAEARLASEGEIRERVMRGDSVEDIMRDYGRI